MLGHQFLRSWQDHHNVKVTLRQSQSYYRCDLFTAANSFFDVDVRVEDNLRAIIEDFQPDAVVNAVGITKQQVDDRAIIPTIAVNALFPHHLAKLSLDYHTRLVLMSTDCVFSGETGYYNEHAVSDAKDLYGRTKFLGEVNQAHVITLRKSTIGLELTKKHGLIEWFLQQHGTITGYRKAIYSGLIASELANVIETILLQHPSLHGVWNVASEPINKYDLLVGLSQRLKHQDVEIIPSDDFICDRSLDGRAFCQQTSYTPPTWDVMLDELAKQIRKRTA